MRALRVVARDVPCHNSCHKAVKSEPDPALSDLGRVAGRLEQASTRLGKPGLDEGKVDQITMKKIHLIGVAMFAVLALSALTAASAFAESEVLIGGEPAVAGAVIEAEGELELTDNKTLLGAATVLCSGIVVGKMTSSTAATVTSVLDLALNTLSTILGTEGLLCTNVKLCEEPLVWPEELGTWSATIILSGGVALLDLVGKYDIECMKGVQLSDLCEGLTEFLIENLATDFDIIKNVEEDEAEIAAGTAGHCELGGANSGTVLTQGEVLVISAGGATAVD